MNDTSATRPPTCPTYEERLLAQWRQRKAEQLAVAMLGAIYPERRWLDLSADERQRWADAALAAYEAGRESERGRQGAINLEALGW